MNTQLAGTNASFSKLFLYYPEIVHDKSEICPWCYIYSFSIILIDNSYQLTGGPIDEKISLTLLILLLALTAAACGSKNESTASKASGTASEKKKIEYLDKTYEVTVPTDKIAITGSVESMEDAKLLDVHPQGAISFSGKFPDMFKDITDKAQSTGEKMEPNIEKILEMKPDVILASTKFPEKTLQKISTAGTTIPVSHISSNWKENMMLLAQLTGKEKKRKKSFQIMNRI